MRRRLLRAMMALVILALAPVSRGASYFTYSDIGLNDANPIGLTESGYIAGLSVDSGAFLGNTIGPYTLLPDHRQPSGIRDAADGSVWVVDKGKYRWSSATGVWEDLGYRAINLSGAEVWDVNRSGAVVGTFGTSFQRWAFAYADFGDGWKTHVLPSFSEGYVDKAGAAGAHAISDSGYIVGGLPATATELHAFVYRNGVMKDLGPGVAVHVNEVGQVLIRDQGMGSEAYIYDDRDGSMRALGGSTSYIANSINRWGQVVGTFYNFTNPKIYTPFLWERGRFYNLKNYMADASFEIINPVAINDRGQITGWGFYDWPNDKPHAVLMTPVTGTSPFFPTSGAMELGTQATEFARAPSDKWYAPGTAPAGAAPQRGPARGPGGIPGVAAQGYHYTAVDGSRFVQVADFPDGFKTPVRLAVGDVVLGQFKPGDKLIFADYAALLGALLADGGVTTFTVTGIDPDLTLSHAPKFSLQLGFFGGAGDFAIRPRNNLLGDANGDSRVNYTDFVVLSSFFGQDKTSWYDGDFDLDGTVGASDFNLFRTHIDSPLSEDEAARIEAFAATVPEPATGVVAGLGLVCALLVGRRGAARGSGPDACAIAGISRAR